MSSNSPIVKLNIGGTLFQTTKSTLSKFDGFFKTILETDVPVTKDESGIIFIDRDPKHFRRILNFMRDGHVELPESSEFVKEIRNEAQYYLLEGLVELCTAKIPSKKIRFIKDEYELIEICADPKKPVLIVKLPDDDDSQDCVDADWSRFVIFELLEKYEQHLDVYFQYPKNQNVEVKWKLYGGKIVQYGFNFQEKNLKDALQLINVPI